MTRKRINLFHGDCLELMKNIPDKSVDLILIDPPYIFDTDGGGAFGSKKREYHSLTSFISKGFDFQVFDILKTKQTKTNMYIYGNKNLIFSLIEHFNKDKKLNIDLLVWHKTNPSPMCNNKYLSDLEYILFVREKGVKLYGEYSTKKKLFQSPTNKVDKKLYKHPTCKPVDQLEILITNSTKENDTVLDCFMGSGSTGIACLNTNRNFIGIEKDDNYFQIAKDRIEKHQSK